MRKLIEFRGDGSFDYATASEEELKREWNYWYPAGSGPLNVMREVCRVIQALAIAKGYDISKWER
jgi:hypothetical protein